MIGLTWILSGQRDRCIRPREARSGDDPSTRRKEARKQRQVLKIRAQWSLLHCALAEFRGLKGPGSKKKKPAGDRGLLPPGLAKSS